MAEPSSPFARFQADRTDKNIAIFVPLTWTPGYYIVRFAGKSRQKLDDFISKCA